MSGGGLLPLLGGDEVMRAEPSGWDQGPAKETAESPPLRRGHREKMHLGAEERPRKTG